MTLQLQTLIDNAWDNRAELSPASAPKEVMDAVEHVLAELDAGQLPLDQLLSRYQRGAELLSFCRARLDAVEEQIKVLEGGELKPWTAD